MNTILLIAFILIPFSGNREMKSPGQKIDITTVNGFELDRYLGEWYEIARFPHRFEKGLTGVTATYKLNQDGSLEVINRGFKDSLDGKESLSVGKARVAGKPGEGKLKVSFFLFFYADYLILELDSENYQWALVGSSSPGYLWILSRTPVIDEVLYESIIAKARERGYDTDKIIKVIQRQN